MSNRIPKKLPENLREFARLANISNESLGQILENLKQSGIEIKNPEEKLSPKVKAQLLAFFKGKTGTSTGPKQTRVSQLKSSTGSAKSITITRVTRKAAQEQRPDTQPPEEEFTTPDNTKELNQEAVIQTSTDSPIVETSEPVTPSETVSKNPKTPTLRKKPKLESFLKVTKRNKRKVHAEIVQDTDEDGEITPSITVTSSQQDHDRDTNLNQTFEKPTQSITRDIWIPDHLTVIELAKKMSVKDLEVMEYLRKIGIQLEHSGESIDQDTAVLLVEEMGHRPKLIVQDAEELALRESLTQKMGNPQKRPPIVTIMGHVDHGKTSLLDYIRREKVAAQEAGGITQHIGAYHVESPKGVITFLDTPGHAAFTAMRARGAHLTDIVALVVAADDGVQPQTQEAIEHAQAANVPIVVVVNKMDKPGASMDLAQQGLSQYNLIAEDWGGETLFVGVSAKTGDGIDDLLDTLLLQAEMLELSTPKTGPAQGIIIESRLDKGQGPVATMIVQKGTLKKGDILLAGTTFGKVRALRDENGKSIPSATPSIPVEILGLSTPPLAGEEALVVPNERKAREMIQLRTTKVRESQRRAQANSALESFMDPFNTQSHKLIHIVLKADVQGSAEALKEALLKLSTEEVKIKLLMTGVGTITESDVNLAIASEAIIFGFNVRTDNAAKRLIQQEKVVTHSHSIIYELLDEAKKIVNGLTEPQFKETIIGKATVRELFKSTKTGTVAGCIVTEGTIHVNHSIRIIRNDAVIHEGKLHSLRRFKDDVKEVKKGIECGINLKNYTDLAIGDMIEAYERTLMG